VEMPDTKMELHFPARWRAEVLGSRPLILPRRHFVYPQAVEEVEKGALEVMIWPEAGAGGSNAEDRKKHLPGAQPFLATCALGFRDPVTPSGVWSCPRAEEICLVAGGYAYVVDTAAPERFRMVEMRPVLEVRAAEEAGLLLFVGHRTVMAWSADGLRWQSEPLSDEGLTITAIDGEVLRGVGWEMRSDREREFVLELGTGRQQS